MPDIVLLTFRACLQALSLLLGGCGVVALYGLSRGHFDAMPWAAVLLGLATALLPIIPMAVRK